LSWGTGAILGPVVGGGFSDSGATWRWAFYINLPLAGLLSPVYFFIMPANNPRKDLSFRQKLQEIDWVGAVLNGAVIVLFMVVISFGGSTYAWNSGSTIALFVVFGVCLITYILQQRFSLFTTPERRIFPVHFLKSRTMLLLYVATAAAAAANAVTLYYIPLFFQFTKGDSSLEAAVRLLPFMCIFIFANMLAGGSLPAFGRYSVYYIVGGAFTLIGGSLMFTINTTTSISKIYGYEILIAFGTGFMFQNAYAIAAAKVPIRDRPGAIGFINVSQIGTIAIGLAIAGSLFQNLGFNSLKTAFAGYGFSDDYIRSALAGSISPVFSSSDEKIVQIAIDSVSKTIQRVFGMTIAGAAVTFVAGLLMKHEKIALDVVAG
jgi:MFS family permease